MNRPELDFRKLTLVERLLKNGFAALLRLGLGLDHKLSLGGAGLQDRSSLFDSREAARFNGKRFLVAPRDLTSN